MLGTLPVHSPQQGSRHLVFFLVVPATQSVALKRAVERHMMLPGIEMGNCGSDVRDPVHLHSPLRHPDQAGHISPQLQQWTAHGRGEADSAHRCHLRTFLGFLLLRIL